MNTRYLHSYFKDYAFGGNTFAMEYVDGRLFVGVSHCSEKDQFNKAIGRDIAECNLDELKEKYKTDGVEIITIGSDMKGYGKITAFVVDDHIMYHLLIDNLVGLHNRWSSVLSHITVDVLDFDYTTIEGAEMKELLIDYYNEIVDNVFPEDNQVHIGY